jgi:hypothetical protein
MSNRQLEGYLRLSSSPYAQQSGTRFRERARGKKLQDCIAGALAQFGRFAVRFTCSMRFVQATVVLANEHLRDDSIYAAPSFAARAADSQKRVDGG